MANYDLDYEGSVVQDILDTGKSLEDDGYIFLGTATPSTIPGTPTERVAYIGGPGTYNNFGTTTVVPSGSIVVITYSGSAWSKTVINASLPVSTTLENNHTTIPTGKAVKTAIDAINTKLGEGYLYAGIATATTNPGTPTGNVFYLAKQEGTYTNFGSLIVTRGINILKYNGSTWSKEQLLAIDGWMSRKATRLYNAAISLAYDDGEIAATITPTAASPFLYFELGYTGLASTTKQATLTVVNGINYIYYSASDQNLHLTSNVDDTLEGGILLEAFYAYQGTPLFAAWTSTFVTKTGFGTDYNASCAYVNPKQFADLTKDVRDLQKSHNKLTNLVSCSISLTSSSGSIAAALTLAQGQSQGYLYHERGYFTQGASASAQLSLSSNGVYIIYYDATAYTIKITNDLSQMSESCVILEVFYAYNGAPTYCCWTSPSVVKVNFPAWYTDSFSSYSNNSDIEKALSVFPYSDKTFRRVGCIGDSYTAGRIYTSEESGVDCEEFSWPHYLQNITGNVYSNFGVSGSTAKGWMSGAAKLSEVQAAGNKCQAYIIGLMINDRSEASWNLYYTPVGVIGDIGTNNDTYYAWYYKLVQAIRAVNTSAPIFCNTCPKYAADDAYNQAVRDIVNYCHTRSQKVYLNDLASAKYKNERYFLNQDFVADERYGHYTAIGYEFMAESLMRIISDTVNDNQAEFTGIHLIPYDATDIKCDGVFDISVNNPTNGQPTSYVDLQAALGTNGANVPVGIRKGGMSVKFIKGTVQSSDNKYVQYRLMSDSFDTTVTNWQGVDKELVAGSHNLAESGVVTESVNKESLKTSKIQSDLYQSASINLLWYLGKLYGTTGFSDDTKRMRSQKLPAGKYNITPVSNYQYQIISYISDTEGVVIYNWGTSARQNIVLESDFFVNIRNSSNTVLSNTDLVAIQNSFKIDMVSSAESLSQMRTHLGTIDLHLAANDTHINKVEEKIYKETEDITYNLSVGDRLSNFFTADYVKEGNKLGVTFVSSDNNDLNEFDIAAYNGSTLIGRIDGVAVGNTSVCVIPADTTKIHFFNALNVESATEVVIKVFNAGTLEFVFDEIDKINEAVFPNKESGVSFAPSIVPNVLAEMYFPNITSAWKITRVTSNTNGTAVLSVKDANGDVFIKTALTDVISPFYRNGETIGYFRINSIEGGYSKTNANGYALNVDNVTNIENSPNIKEYLARKENIVLLGDSGFGYRNENYLLEYLINKTDKFIANAGFAGCRAAWRTLDGSSDWDKMSLVDVVDAIVNNDFTAMLAAIGNIGDSRQYFKDRVASLRSVDWTKPTTVFIEYGNNDVTGGTPIGNLWDKTQSIATYDKTTYLGAMNYGMAKLSQAYPNVKIIVHNPGWRMIGGTVEPDGGTSGDPVAPYEYTNSAGITFYQYLAAIKENCERCGVRLFNQFRMGGRCVFNWDYYSYDDSHYNQKGYEMFADALVEESNNL